MVYNEGFYTFCAKQLRKGYITCGRPEYLFSIVNKFVMVSQGGNSHSDQNPDYEDEVEYRDHNGAWVSPIMRNYFV